MSATKSTHTATAALAALAAAERVLSHHLTHGARLCVGLSGGVDSVVLLEMVCTLAPRHGWRLSALHVNHQLSAQAGAWVRFCRRLCRERAVPLRVVKVTVPRGNSIEAAARAARYAAYRAQPAENIVLAQHQDDQVETVLLQLLRGAGVKGLAAMPIARVDALRPGLTVLRPLLALTRREIEAYAAARKLAWVEDDSNQDAYYLRNFLRLDILPRIAQRAPDYRNTVSRAAAHMAEAAELLDALAQQDGGGALMDGALPITTLPVTTLQPLSAARARNVLRYFLASQQVGMPDARRLAEALRQVLTAKADARVCVDLGVHQLRRFAGALHVIPAQQALPRGFMRAWRGERRLAAPELQATLEMRKRRGAGIDLAKLIAKPVTLRLRGGGEKLQPDAARPRRAVKDLFQEQGVPPWQRERLPYLWSGETLVWVAGLGVDCAFAAGAGVPGVAPLWTAGCP